MDLAPFFPTDATETLLLTTLTWIPALFSGAQKKQTKKKLY